MITPITIPRIPQNEYVNKNPEIHVKAPRIYEEIYRAIADAERVFLKNDSGSRTTRSIRNTILYITVKVGMILALATTPPIIKK
jgi:hypothetical protein